MKEYLLTRVEWNRAGKHFNFLKDGQRNLIEHRFISSTTSVTYNDGLYRMRRHMENMTPHIRIHEDIFKENTWYTLSFKSRKISGQINRIGGHSTIHQHELTQVFVNGKDVTRELRTGWTNPGTYEYPDSEVVFIEVIFKTVEDISNVTNKGVYIQPNRPNYQGYLYDTYIYDIKVEEGKRSTKWVPYADEFSPMPLIESVGKDVFDLKYNELEKKKNNYQQLKSGNTNLILDSHNMKITGSDARTTIEIINEPNLIRVEAIQDRTTTTNFYNVIFANSWENKEEVFENIKNGEAYTLSADVKYSGDSSFQMGFDTRSPENALYARTPQIRDTNGEWVRVHTTKIEKGRGLNVQSLLIGWFMSVKKEDYVEIRNIKLEKGETPSKWTPNPKDIDADIFTIKLAEQYFKKQSQIDELRNAVISLGGVLNE